MASSGMLRRVALVRTDVSEELSASFIRVTRISELGTLAVTSIQCTLHLYKIHPTECSGIINAYNSGTLVQDISNYFNL
jgi:hypothetical protein